MDGMTILSFPSLAPWMARKLFKQCDADIYHSQEPSFGTFIAQRVRPDRKHIVTFRDPRNFDDWKIEFLYPSISKFQVLLNWLYEDNFLVKNAVKRADRVFFTAKHLSEKVKSKYSFKSKADFLPTPVDVPDQIQKAQVPTVCFLGRWDRRKRPELFFELAKKNPQVKFIAVGKSRDVRWDQILRDSYCNLPNLEMAGFINQFSTNELSAILGKSWILINTSSREGLPTSFLEALAHRCSILSSVNPDSVVERFGWHVKDDDFSKGLEHLLKDNQWKEKGERGYQYVKENYEIKNVINQHISLYEMLIKK
jgi:glycosyltransferase involved in cell wall biosynthesis